ncbi:MAG: type IV pilin N-terminal domain-containing protein [Thermoplasmata archaeon]|nr:type IV pilin N-terminal domain-containing protein [Thermoplasmata archaeon]
MGKMKANRKFKQADERAVSAVIGVILMVAITVAIAATVYVYVSGMIGGTKTQTPNVACTTDATANKITVATADANIKWKDVVITLDNASTHWTVYYGGGIHQAVMDTAFGSTNTTEVTAGDYILLTSTFSGNVKATLRYTPTNSLLGSWTINV